MEEVTGLNALVGSYINPEHALPGGRTIKLPDDNKIYPGNQIHKRGSDRCCGLAADESFLPVCEYGCGGTDAEIVLYKRRIAI